MNLNEMLNQMEKMSPPVKPEKDRKAVKVKQCQRYLDEGGEVHEVRANGIGFCYWGVDRIWIYDRKAYKTQGRAISVMKRGK